MSNNQRRFSIVMASLLVGLVFWVGDGVYDYFTFEETIKELIFHEPLSLWDALFLNVPRDDVISRICFALAALLAGLIVVLYMERVESDAVKLRKSEMRNRMLFENALAGLCSISSGGRVLAANKAFASMLGFDAKPVDMDEVGDFFSINMWLLGPLQDLVGEARSSNEPVVREMTLRDRNDKPFRALVSLKSVMEFAAEYRFELSMLDISGRYEAEKIQRSLSRRLVRIQEDERRYLALELHDDLAQDIATLKIAVSAISNEEILEGSESMRNIVLCQRLVSSLMIKTRSMMHNLKPYELTYVDLEEGIRNYINNTMLDSGVTIDHDLGRLSRLDISLEAKIHLFRIVQAAVANSVRHSGVHRLTVNAAVEDGRLALSIVDSGKGFNVDEFMNKPAIGGGRGLLGMRERADILNADLVIDSVPGRGTTVRVTAPIDRIVDED